MGEISWLSLGLAFLAALVAGAMNSIAGGGTLLTFPLLIAVGLDDKVANITSTLGLWPGSLGGAWGYRQEIAQDTTRFWPFFLPSLLGGALGAGLLLWTSNESFKMLVPWLIFAATVLFILQGEIARRQQAKLQVAEEKDKPLRWPLVVIVQFLVAVYGGYFGAGIGILMLATLGFLGLKDIHQMNGVKNIGGVCINGIAILLFLLTAGTGTAKVIDWPVAGAMAVGAVIGGYACAGLAKRIGPKRVRHVVIAIGVFGAVWTGYRLAVGA
jgi:hypothetical protein